MNEIVNKLLLAGNKFMPEMHFVDLLTALVDHLLKTKKDYEKLKKHEIQDIFIKRN